MQSLCEKQIIPSLLYYYNFLFTDKFFVGEEFFVCLRDESLSTVATIVDLWLVQVDVDPGMAQCSSSSITPCVCALHNCYWLFC